MKYKETHSWSWVHVQLTYRDIQCVRTKLELLGQERATEDLSCMAFHF